MSAAAPKPVVAAVLPYPWLTPYRPYWPTWYSTGIATNQTSWQSSLTNADSPRMITVKASA